MHAPDNTGIAETTRLALGVPPSSPWPADASRDRLAGDWHLWQRKKGHRTSTDDFLTAAYATRWMEGQRPDRYLDIGCGIGSVLLQTVYALRPHSSYGVEAQAQSATLAVRSVEELPDGPPIVVRHGDLRAIDVQRAGRFDLITGSPPYLPIGTGTPSADVQRHACRFELRGGVEAYADTARQLLSEKGLFVLVFQTQWESRVLEAGRTAGLHLHARARVRMREDAPAPFLGVYGWRTTPQNDRQTTEEELTVRDAKGQWTKAFVSLRRSMGLEAPPSAP